MHVKKHSRIANFEACSLALFTGLALSAGLVAAQPVLPAARTLQAAAAAPKAAGDAQANEWTMAQIRDAFKKTDQNHDGTISREEATIWTGLARQFGLVDRNRDGSISSAEFDEALK